MKRQLVLEFAADSLPDFDRLIALETTLIEKLGNIAIVDGHDFQMRRFNIFLLTNNPGAPFAEAHKIVLREAISNDMRSAYRRIGRNEYVRLWPSPSSEFVL